MNEIFNILYTTILDALFPLSKAEKEVFSYSPEQAFSSLSHTSSLADLTIPPAHIDNIHAMFAYKDERVSKLIWNIKYKRSAPAATIGAYALWRGLKALPHDSLILVPMPMTTKRRRERGFNQCELLVDAIKRLDVENKLTVATDLLVRTQHADRQTLKDREERMKDAKGIFVVDKEYKREFFSRNPNLKNSPVVVIDDVVTTGSTIDEAMETLRAAGFQDVYGLALAH